MQLQTPDSHAVPVLQTEKKKRKKEKKQLVVTWYVTKPFQLPFFASGRIFA